MVVCLVCRGDFYLSLNKIDPLTAVDNEPLGIVSGDTVWVVNLTNVPFRPPIGSMGLGESSNKEAASGKRESRNLHTLYA